MTVSAASRPGCYGAGRSGRWARSWHAWRTGTPAELLAVRKTHRVTQEVLYGPVTERGTGLPRRANALVTVLRRLLGEREGNAL